MKQNDTHTLLKYQVVTREHAQFPMLQKEEELRRKACQIAIENVIRFQTVIIFTYGCPQTQHKSLWLHASSWKLREGNPKVKEQDPSVLKR